MSFTPNLINDDILHSIFIVSTYCIKIIDIETARNMGVQFTEEDVKENTIRGVYYSSSSDSIDYIYIDIDEIQTAWINLGFKDGEFVTERRLNEKYFESVRKLKK